MIPNSVEAAVEHASIRFEQYLKRRYSGSSTAKHYLSDLNIFMQTIGNKPAEWVTPADIDTFVDTQIAAGLGPATINRRLATLHTFFEYLASEDLTHNWPNPVIWRRHGVKLGDHLPRDAGEDEVARLFSVMVGARDRAMFGLMVGAGLRVGEVSALRLDSLEIPSEIHQLTRLRVLGKGNKERIVWCAPSLRVALDEWYSVRPNVDHKALFLNRQGDPITVSGIQYCLKGYCKMAGIELTCHELRHTFARRMTENGLPVDSLAKLMGHEYLQTTVRYIRGADPTVRADFAAAMEVLDHTHEGFQLPGTDMSSLESDWQPSSPPSPNPAVAPQAELHKLREALNELPAWLRDAVDAYITWRWPSWRPQNAYRVGHQFVCGMRRLWTWLEAHCEVDGWESFRRTELEAWLTARCESGISNGSIQAELTQIRGLLRFLAERDYPLDAGLWRVRAPERDRRKLPRYLPEDDYHRLEQLVLGSVHPDPYDTYFDRAWFLILAHTGMRRSELLDLRLDDLDLLRGTAMIRQGKGGLDRVVYLTHPLTHALQQYLTQRPDLSDNDHVFILDGHSPAPETIRTRLDRYGQQVGVKVSPHRLRHTFATRLLNRGMPITSLQKLLGHKHLDTTQRYAQVYDDTLYAQFQAVASRLESIPVENWPLPEAVAQPILSSIEA
jgi:site-specific recombinase XerD